MAKYQKLFLEEATEHLSEISHALLELEKDTSGSEPIDTIFRMAHSIKSMAASLGYDAVAELAHRLEDRMETHRRAGRVSSQGELSLLFRGLEGLERMVGVVRDTGEPPSPDAPLMDALAGSPAADVEDQARAPAAMDAPTAPDVGPEGRVPPSVAGAGVVDSKKKGLS